MNDPDQNYFNDKFQETDSPYFSFQNFNIFLRQLTEKAFSICHYNIKSLNKNIDKLKEFLASLNGSFGESWCDRTANKNSRIEVPNYSPLYKTIKSRKEGGICVYINKSLKFNVRDDKDIFNESVETLSTEIQNKKSRNIVTAVTYRPPKGSNKLFKDFCNNFLNKQEMPNKAAFLLGDSNLNALDYETNETAKKFLI